MHYYIQWWYISGRLGNIFLFRERYKGRISSRVGLVYMHPRVEDNKYIISFEIDIACTILALQYNYKYVFARKGIYSMVKVYAPKLQGDYPEDYASYKIWLPSSIRQILFWIIYKTCTYELADFRMSLCKYIDMFWAWSRVHFWGICNIIALYCP